jgi:hypothetical protein
MPSHIVDANYRFVAAYNEVNARIAQRQQALALYVSIVIGLLAATVAVLVAAGNFVGLGANVAIFPTRFAQAPTFMYASGLLALASFAVVLMTSRWHYAPKAPS